MQAYALCTLRNYVMMAIHAGCSEDQVFGVVVDGIDRASAARAAMHSYGRAADSAEGRLDRRYGRMFSDSWHRSWRARCSVAS